MSAKSGYKQVNHKRPNVTIRGQTIRLKRSILPVTESNASVLQFPDTISQAEKYLE